ncbi:glycosyltransferase family 2 protein [Niastella koreensis]|uniref:glycosyltransferase family 2 protein n=1 Tax=Niastella koreensis TaxID=354356 RepID=UPI0013FE4679|nr:glycosyltransferase family A protein [Niastella koreensis]
MRFNTMGAKVSIIIPCYNQGHFLDELLDSIRDCNSDLYELIIVNDGSTDQFTNDKLRELKAKGYQVIFQENKGLSGARNTGIQAATGEYILPLDSDNKVRPAYLTRAIEVMDAAPRVAVVYGNAEYFGEQTGTWKTGAYNMQKLMIANFIDACAVIRRSVFDKVGLYDTNMKLGWEDWDMWLRISFAGYEFRYVDEVLFDYRVLNTSMSKTLYNNYAKPNSIENYLHEKYATRMGHQYITAHWVKRFRKSPVLFIAKLILMTYFPRYYNNKLLKKNKVRNGL